MDFALEQGRTVYAVPGRVHDPLSEGCHRLIAQGAGIAYKPELILEELHIDTEKQQNKKRYKERNSKLGLATNLELVYSCLDLQLRNMGDNSGKSSFDLQELSGILLELQFLIWLRKLQKIIMQDEILVLIISRRKMYKYFVIVESPAKVKTIKKFLGSNYEVAKIQRTCAGFAEKSVGELIRNMILNLNI